MINEISINIEGVPLNEVLERLEREVLKYAMEVSKFNQSEAARQLNMSRGTLRKKLIKAFPGVYI